MEVTLGAPAELVTGAGGAALDVDKLGAVGTELAGVFWAEGVITSATEYGVTVFAIGRSFLAVTGAMLTFTAATGVPPVAATDVEPPPVTLAMPSPLFTGALAAVAAAGGWVRGTAPLPGVPIPGNTVPC